MVEKLSNLSRVLYDKVVGEFLVGNDIGFDGETAIQQFVQTTPEKVWEIRLNILGVVVLTFVFENNEDGTYTLIQPQSVKRITDFDIQVTFNTPVAGVANVVVGTEAIDKFQGALTPTPTLTRTITPTPEPTISITPSVTPPPTPGGTPVVTPTISITPSVTPVGQPTLNDYVYLDTTFTTELPGFILDMHFATDGLKLYIPQREIIYAYNLTVPFDISTASYGDEFSAAAEFTSIAISSDGTKFFGLRTDDTIQDGVLTIAGNISTLILGDSWPSPRNDIEHIQVRTYDETQLYIKYTNDATLERRIVGTAWDATTIGAVQDSVDLDSLAPGLPLINDFIIDPALGNAIYIFRGLNEIVKFVLGTPWDLTTVVFDASQTLDTTTTGESFANTLYAIGVTEVSGGKIIVNGGITAEIYEFVSST